MSFLQRITAAASHEQSVIAALRDSGWDAEPFGQGQLPKTIRNHLRNCSPITPVRWMPDIIAARSTGENRSRVVFIDAKAGEKWRKTGNHDIEIAALAGADSWAAWSRCKVIFVFTDWLTTTPDRIQETGKLGPYYGNGSGTKYLLFPCRICKPFDVEFCTPPTQAS